MGRWYYPFPYSWFNGYFLCRQACSPEGHSTSKFAIVLRGTLSQDDIVDAEGLPGQVRDLELLNLEDLGIRSFNEACYISLGTDSRLRYAPPFGSR